MLLNLKLNNFRKVVSDEMTFTKGINVLRGANEASKSTRIEAIFYALFGTSALRTSLEEAVTWGENVKSLKVELTLQIGDKTYVFARSKAGSEVTVDGTPFVTGQKETALFAANLLGADLSTAAKLIAANQGNIRGALEEGPKALSVLIEDLSDMSIFDRILEAAQSKLVLGNPCLLEERLKGAKATLEAATANLPPAPDAESHHAALTALANAIAADDLSVVSLGLASVAATSEYEKACRLFNQKLKLEEDVKTARDRVLVLKKQVDELRPAASVVVTDNREALRMEIAQAEAFHARQVAWRFFQNLPTGERFLGTSEDFQKKCDTVSAEYKAANARLAEIDKQSIAARTLRINHDKCDKCGQDVTHLASVIETNARVDAELARLEPLREQALKDVAEATAASNRCDEVSRFARKLQAELPKVSSFVVLDESVYPPRVMWNPDFPVPTEAPDVEALKAALMRNESQIAAVVRAKAQFDLAEKNLAEAELAHGRASNDLSVFDAPEADDILELERRKNDAVVNLEAAKGRIVMAKDEMKALTTAFDSAKALWAMSQSRIADAQKTIADCEKDLESLSFNNNLVKKLRALRPMVADQLWNTVLASVSVMFSQMRGEASVVSKGKDGFRVNGQAVESLSGSTKDVLGLAIRCSLLRTFIPECNLLILDEPMQGCDDVRSAAMLGFLKSVDFGQVLLVTHENVSESVADNIIELEVFV